MNFKPNKLKVIVSVVVLMSVITFLYATLACMGGGFCELSPTQIIALVFSPMVILGIIPFAIVYVLWSLIEKTPQKKP